jgi:hypothetical protein
MPSNLYCCLLYIVILLYVLIFMDQVTKSFWPYSYIAGKLQIILGC